MSFSASVGSSHGVIQVSGTDIRIGGVPARTAGSRRSGGRQVPVGVKRSVHYTNTRSNSVSVSNRRGAGTIATILMIAGPILLGVGLALANPPMIVFGATVLAFTVLLGLIALISKTRTFTGRTY